MYKGYIYRHWIVNDKGIEKNYIGQVYNRTPKQRWRNGKGYLSKRKDGRFSYFGNAIQKYGWDNFNHKVLFSIECETLEELVFWLDEWEKYYIEKYDSFYNGYNGDTGGKNGYIVSETTKKRQSNSHKAFYSTEQGKQLKQQISKKGEDNPFYGKKHSGEAKQKISESRKQYVGEKHPNYGKTGEQATFYGKHHTEEFKKRQSEMKKGVRTDSQIQQMKKVICLNTLQVFHCIADAKQWCGVKNGISKCCQGKCKSTGKHPETGEPLKWMYYSDYLEQLNKNNPDSNNNKIAQSLFDILAPMTTIGAISYKNLS